MDLWWLVVKGGLLFLRRILFRFIDATFRFRGITLLFLQLAIVFLSAWLAYWIRFEAELPSRLHDLFIFTLLAIAIKIPIVRIFKLNHGWWRYTSIPDLKRIILACTVAS